MQDTDNRRTVTVVVFGASRSGKTSLLRGVHDRLGAGRGMTGRDDPTHSAPLDWLALDLGNIAGRPTTVLMYAVPGLVTYDTTRRLLLDSADGVIFVADLQAARLDENVEAVRMLREHLDGQDGSDATTTPVVYFYSKHDLPAELLVDAAQLDAALMTGDAPSIAGDAVRGEGIREALQAVLTLVFREIGMVGEPDE